MKIEQYKVEEDFHAFKELETSYEAASAQGREEFEIEKDGHIHKFITSKTKAFLVYLDNKYDYTKY